VTLELGEFEKKIDSPFVLRIDNFFFKLALNGSLLWLDASTRVGASVAAGRNQAGQRRPQ
jgi:hypothetical protein